MITLIILAAIFFVNESIEQNQAELERYIYSIFGTSLLIATALTGLITILLAFSRITWLPSWIIALSISACWFCRKRGNNKWKQIRLAIAKEINKANYICQRQRTTYVLIAIVITLILLASLGPINHPDAADYHAGYPYQIFRQNTFVIDGGLHQGLVSLNEYAYLAFFQENLSWLIRASQVLFLIPIIFYLINKKTDLLLVLSFSSMPIFLQWGTTGKPLFLHDSIITIAYLTWYFHKTGKALQLLIMCVSLGICFKISSLIICIPIFIHIGLYYRKNISSCRIHIKTYELIPWLVCIMSIITTIAIKLYLTSNPLYPLLSKYFTPSDWHKIEFEQILKTYNGVGEPFPISLFISSSLQFVGTCLGTGILVGLLIILTNKYNLTKYTVKVLVGLAQILLLLWIGQKRGDYYTSPLIILICGSTLHDFGNSYNDPLNELFIKLFKFLALPIQVATSVPLLIFSTYQTVMATLNYERQMNLMASGYQVTQDLIKYANGRRYLNYLTRGAKLYSPSSNYVSSNKIKYCIGEQRNPSRLYTCIKKYDIDVVALGNDTKQKLENKLESCSVFKTVSAARNIFNRKDLAYYICDLK